MGTCLYNLLEEPLIRIRTMDDGIVRQCSLPQVYEQMVANNVSSFPALRPHQKHAWHAFLAQLGVIAMYDTGVGQPPAKADSWKEMLRNLTKKHKDDSPWCLIVNDYSSPAFMQCPDSRNIKDYKKHKATPDDIDVLVTSKNHDIKQSILVNAQLDDWIFAIVSMQTMSGFIGQGNYGVSRMNLGTSSRVCVGSAPIDKGQGKHLVHDMVRMLACRAKIINAYSHHYKDKSDYHLLWLLPWDGSKKQQLAFRNLDPYFIEICRSIRLHNSNYGITARMASSADYRIAAKEAKGNIGDFWTPVNKKESKSFSLTGGGFRYDLLCKILFGGDYKLPLAISEKIGDDRSLRLVVRGMARGQGKTEGYHERSDIILRKGTVDAALFGDEHAGQVVGRISEAIIAEIKEVNKAMKLGIAIAASGGRELNDLKDEHRKQATPYSKRLDAYANSAFFAELLDRCEAEDKDIECAKECRKKFVLDLVNVAEKLLDDAIESVSCGSIFRYRGQVRAKSVFWGCLRSSKGVFCDQPDIFTKDKENKENAA